MNIVQTILAADPMPPIAALGYEYVVAGNGLFVRAENEHMAACVPIAPACLHGLPRLEPYARLKCERVPRDYLLAIALNAAEAVPREAMYQITHDGQWALHAPAQVQQIGALEFADMGAAVIDVHSHGDLRAFFSATDDADEQGLRFYAVMGELLSNAQPGLLVRVGVFGHHWNVPALTVFSDLCPFRDEMVQEEYCVDRLSARVPAEE